MAKKKRYCEKCGLTLNEDEFYSSNNLEKYPDGRMNLCKKCMTMHVDNWDPETFLWILEEADVPWIESEWNKILTRATADPSKKITGLSVIGRYFSCMKLKQHKNERWADTERIAEERRTAEIDAMKQQGVSDEEIARKLSESHKPERPIYEPDPEPELNSFPIGEFEDEEDEIYNSLTKEDRLMLRLKWGKGYSVEQWVKMEQLYNDMMNSYDIQGAGHKDNLIMLCKTSVKANELLDAGDIDGFQKMQRAYDSLMKSGKFTAAQNKDENGEYVDSVGELVAMCEREGFIPRYYTDGPQDKVDRTIQDLQQYTRTLVTEEMNLGNLIESSIKEIEKDRERESHIDVEDGDDDDSLFNYDSDELTYEDYLEFEKLKEETLAAAEEGVE